MKAVELRSLNLLEGAGAQGKVARGKPMAASRSYGVLPSVAQPAPVATPAAEPAAAPLPPTEAHPMQQEPAQQEPA